VQNADVDHRRGDISRRRFLQNTIAGGVAVATVPGTLVRAATQTSTPVKTPWYLRAYRWGQTNITEQDPVRYDIPWWRGYWKRTQVQAVIINAGGIVAY